MCILSMLQFCSTNSEFALQKVNGGGIQLGYLLQPNLHTSPMTVFLCVLLERITYSYATHKVAMFLEKTGNTNYGMNKVILEDHYNSHQ